MPTAPTGNEPYTPVKITSTSATERGGFRRCRRQWFLTVVHRLDPAEGNPNFFLGKTFHAGLEAYYKTLLSAPGAIQDAEANALDAYQDFFDKSMVELAKDLGFLWLPFEAGYRQIGELGFEMLQNYLERERTNPLFDKVIAVEFRVNVPIKNAKGRKVGVLSVQADAVGVKDGELAVADHKTASTVMPSAHLDIDDQLTAEVYAWWHAKGDFPERAIYNVAYKKAPKPPRQIKGTKAEPIKLSKDRNQLTTYALYREEIKRLGLDVGNYVDILTTLKEREDAGEDPLFRREVTFRTFDQLAEFERNLFEEYRDMKAVAAHPERAYPNPTSMNCSRCPVRTICTTMMDSGDVNAIIQANFTVLDPRR